MFTLTDLFDSSLVLSDQAIEADIETARRVLTDSPDRQTKAEAFTAMVKLIRARSPERIAAMETERGLRLQ